MRKKIISAVSAGAAVCGAACLPFSAIRFAGLALLGIALCVMFFILVSAKRLKIAAAAVLAVGLSLFLAAEIPVLAGAHSDRDTQADYLVVAGSGVNGAEPSHTMLQRLDAALAWLEENPQGIAIVSGSRGDCGEQVSEAQAMQTWLLAQGIAPERVIMEEQAECTADNVRYALEIIRQRGGDSAGTVAFASSEYHLFRIRMLARQAGCSPVCTAGHTRNPVVFINYAVREALAVWKTWVSGP